MATVTDPYSQTSETYQDIDETYQEIAETYRGIRFRYFLMGGILLFALLWDYSKKQPALKGRSKKRQ